MYENRIGDESGGSKSYEINEVLSSTEGKRGYTKQEENSKDVSPKETKNEKGNLPVLIRCE